MHSKYDRLVVFLIVGGSLLMLFGAISSLLNYIGYINGETKPSESVQVSADAVASKPVASKPLATEVESLSDSEKNEKKIVDCIITAINDERKEEEAYKEILKLQSGKPELDLFKSYVGFLRMLSKGKVVGYKPVSAAETKAIQLEMLENSRTSLLVFNKYKCFNLISEIKPESEKENKQEKMILLVLPYIDGKLELNERLINDLVEPHYIARLYAEGLNNADRNLLANVLYTDLPDDEEFRLNQADAYVDYYRKNVDVSVENLQIEEARPDMWLISFPKKSDGIAETNAYSEAMSDESEAKETTSGSEAVSNDVALEVKAFNSLHFSPKYFIRWQMHANRHYVQLLRRSNGIVVVDYLPMQNIKGAWKIQGLNSDHQIDLHDTISLNNMKSIFQFDAQPKRLLYNEAVYSGLIKPQISYEDRADKIYSHLVSFNGTGMEAYSFVRRNQVMDNLAVDLLVLSGNKFKTNSPIQIGMTRGELLRANPSLAMSEYKLIFGKTIIELHFNNQSKSGINMRVSSASDRLTHIMYYNIEWYQQDFDLANLHYVN